MSADPGRGARAAGLGRLGVGLWLASGLAGGLAGCFSQADFAECSQSVQCGRGFRCVAERCVPQAPGDAQPFDFGARADLGAGETVVLENQRFTEAQGDQDFSGKTLILRGVTVVDSPSGLVFEAATIRVEGTLEVLGPPGGPGGGGGAAGPEALDFSAGPGPGEPSQRAAAGTEGGPGGPGGAGIGVGAGAGGLGGTPAAPDGQPGAAGRFPIETCAALVEDVLQVGTSGGGGGGGRGAGGGQEGCVGGGGGGGGGAGGRAGGAVALIASQEIFIEGEIIAAGSGGAIEPGPDTLGGPPCGDQCGAPCDPALHGFGGAGALAGGAGQGGGPGAGSGGRGGAGSGGMVRLRAPNIRVERNGIIDLSGGVPEAGGLLALEGRPVGPLDVRGARLSCP